MDPDCRHSLSDIIFINTFLILMESHTVVYNLSQQDLLDETVQANLKTTTTMTKQLHNNIFKEDLKLTIPQKLVLKRLAHSLYNSTKTKLVLR